MHEKDQKELDDLCICSTPKMGRPKKWTEEAIKDFADGLLEYAKKNTTLALGGYAAHKRIDPAIYNILTKISLYFLSTYNSAKRIVGERRERGTVLKRFDSGVYRMTARMFDPDLCDAKVREVERDEYAKAIAKVKAVQAVASNEGEILAYLRAAKLLPDEDDLAIIRKHRGEG